MIGSPVKDSSINGLYGPTLDNERAFETSGALMPLLIRAMLGDVLQLSMKYSIYKCVLSSTEESQYPKPISTHHHPIGWLLGSSLGC